MRGILFDLPDVVERAEAGIERDGLRAAARSSAAASWSAIPGGADAYLLRHIIHNWDDETGVAILRNVREVDARSGRRLLVVERVIPPGNEPTFGKLMDLNMLVIPGGVERTEEEFRRLFEAPGFRLTRIVPDEPPR